MSLKSMNELVKGKCYNDKDGNSLGMLLFKPSVSGIHQNINGKRVRDEWYSAQFMKVEDGKLVDNSIRIEMGQESLPQFQEVDCPDNNELNSMRNVVLSMYRSKNRTARRRRSSRRVWCASADSSPVHKPAQRRTCREKHAPSRAHRPSARSHSRCSRPMEESAARALARVPNGP